jgi:UDP-2,4-diacetamido-2,4,6-trideoxy-beta-L-altropyranose hydrolase
MPFAVFRCDAGTEIGGGHVMRCLSLADVMTDLGWRCAFAVSPASCVTVPRLGRSGHEIVQFDSDDEALALTERWPAGVDLAVIDHYGRDAVFERRLRPWANRILVLDDLADRRHDGDVLVDQTYGRQTADYRGLVPVTCTVLAGAAYALVRPAFMAERPAALRRRATDDRVRRVLIALGSADQANVTSIALEAMTKAAPTVPIDVVLGSGAPHLPSIRRLVAARPNVHLHVDTAAMASLMAEADLTIGLPSLVIVVAENQKTVTAALAAASAAVDLGWHADVTSERLAGAVTALLSDAARRRAMSRCAAAICDGHGALRAVLALLPVLADQDGHPIRLRAAEAADGPIMLDWQRDPTSRRYARNPEPPEETQHFRWLEKKLADPACLFMLIEHSAAPAGVLRLDRLSGAGLSYEISILVAPEKRGLGIAARALKLGRQLVPGAELVAEVLAGNERSAALFEGAGYRRGPDGRFRSASQVN